jgi:hypothetical protein
MQGFKTYIAAAIAAVFGVLAMTDWVSFLSNWKAGAATLGMAILMAVMRSITTTPPGTAA